MTTKKKTVRKESVDYKTLCEAYESLINIKETELEESVMEIMGLKKAIQGKDRYASNLLKENDDLFAQVKSLVAEKNAKTYLLTSVLMRNIDLNKKVSFLKIDRVFFGFLSLMLFVIILITK